MSDFIQRMVAVLVGVLSFVGTFVLIGVIARIVYEIVAFGWRLL